MSGFINTIMTRIQWRVLLTTTIFLFMALIVSDWLQIKEVKQDYLRHLQVKAGIIGNYIKAEIDSVDWEEEHIVNDMKNFTEMYPEFSRIEIFSREGKIVISTFPGVSKHSRIPDDFLNAALGDHSAITEPYHSAITVVYEGNLEVIIPVSIKGQKGDHFIRISSPEEILQAKISKRWIYTLWVLGLSLVLYLSFTFFYLKKDLVNPITILKEHAAHVAKGDVSHDIEVGSMSEIGDVSRAFNDAAHGIKGIISRSKEVLAKVSVATKDIAKGSEQVKNGSKSQAEAMSNASRFVEGLHHNIKDISDNLEDLSSLAEETSSSIIEMTSSINNVDGAVENLSIDVGETSASIEEIGTSFRDVARRIVGLSKRADEAASSISEIDTSIKEIEESASKNAELSNEVYLEGNKGVKSIEQTHHGMEKINEAVQSIYHVIDELGGRVGEIGKILEVVDEVAEETNLLALNAAILAAQAGDYGKGFGVVAEEVRELAERTASSTKEIDNLIKGVQSQTKKAIYSVKEGIERVEEGKTLSLETIETFKNMLNRFKDSQEMSTQIARATEEQARGSKLVTESIEKVTDTIHQMAIAVQQQALGSQMITKSTENMKELTSEIKKATGEQALRSKTISANTEKVTASVNNISLAIAHQKDASQHIVETISTNLTFVEANKRNASELNNIVVALKEDIADLKEGMGRFKLE